MKKKLLIFTCITILSACLNIISAQKVQYASENVFINNPDHLKLVAGISGNNHLLSFNDTENPEIFIYDARLQYQAKVTAPFKFPERTEIRIIRFDNFYYLYMHERFSRKYAFWKIDGNGNFTDHSSYFQKLLLSQSKNIKLGFQLIANEGSLWMVYHTNLESTEKNTVVVIKTDSLLNVVLAHKVVYDFKRLEEKLQQEILMFGKYLVVLKTANSGTSLEMMKVYLNTGYAITNTFSSSGYFYSQASFNYNVADSSFAISALLTEPRSSTNPRRFVFVSRLNNMLFEDVPFKILRSQFKQNTGTDFLLVDGLSQWARVRTEREQAYNNSAYEDNISLYQDPALSDANAQSITDNNRLFTKMSQSRSSSYTTDPTQGVRFSLLNKDLEIANDSLLINSKGSYTIKPDQFVRFMVNNKEHILLGQQFAKNSRGLLMINSNDKQQLNFTDIRVVDRNDYLLTKAQVIPGEGIIIPYIHKLEAGLVKVTLK